VRIGSVEADLAGLSRRFELRAAMHDADATTSRENLAELHTAGLLAAAVPVEFGGAAADLRRIADVVRHIAEDDPSYTPFYKYLRSARVTAATTG
jgi:alkylation response protein AidB-like acyl-CoA dehydrogenase